MLVRLLATILPAMKLAKAVKTTRIQVVTERLFHALHRAISDVGVIGGGQRPMPGEVSLAHHGILGLDELLECTRHVLGVLRQPFETSITEIQSRTRPRPRCAGRDRRAGRGPDRLARTTVAPTKMRSAKAWPGGIIPVDKPAQYPYTRATLPFVGFSYLYPRLVDMREPADVLCLW
jgi:hypothetical protein